MSEKMRFGIVGCGLVANFHARAIAGISDAQLVAVADLNQDRSERLAGQYGAVALTDYRHLLERKDIDVVCVCTPNGAHEQIAVAAIRAGKHLLVEKPLEVTLSKADRIIAEAKTAGVKLGTVFQCRFRPAVVEIKKAIEEGRFGRLLCGDVFMKWYRSGEYYRSEAWRSQPEQGPGVLLQHASHYVDLLQWLLGPVESVIGQTGNLAHPDLPTEDTAMALLKYRNGAMGVVEASTAISPGSEVRLEIHGEYGSAIVEGESMRQWHLAKSKPGDDEIARIGSAERPAAGKGAADFDYLEHQSLIEDMIGAIRQDREPLVGGSEGKKVLEIVDAIHRSARDGKVVLIPAESSKEVPAGGGR